MTRDGETSAARRRPVCDRFAPGHLLGPATAEEVVLLPVGVPPSVLRRATPVADVAAGLRAGRLYLAPGVPPTEGEAPTEPA
jgi:hypothetical protein